MTAKEVIEIVKESNLWESLTQKEKREAIIHALKITQLSTKEENWTGAGKSLHRRTCLLPPFPP